MNDLSRSPLSVQFEEAENTSTNASANATMGDVIAERLSRRDLAKGILAVSAMTATVSPLALLATEHGERARSEHHALVQLQGSALWRRRQALRRRRLRCRYPHQMGRSGLAWSACLRSQQADEGRAGEAVRLQQRLSRLLPASRRAQSIRARPALRQSRVHQRRADVPRPRPAGCASRQHDAVLQDDQGNRRGRNDGARRLGAGGEKDRRQMGGRGQLEIRAPHHRRDRDAHLRSCGGSRQD